MTTSNRHHFPSTVRAGTAITDGMYDEVYDLVGEMEADPSLKVVFESAKPDFFIAHYSQAEPRSRFGTPRWIESANWLA